MSPAPIEAIERMRADLVDVFTAAGVPEFEARRCAHLAYRAGGIGSITTAELLLELKARIGDVTAHAPGRLADLLDTLLEALPPDLLTYRAVNVHAPRLGDRPIEGRTEEVTVFDELGDYERTCRVCGCTDTRACDPPCSWAELDLCTACVDTEAAAR
jgi:hypothetical protein